MVQMQAQGVLARHYWTSHFEPVGVKPAPFIHRIMTDHEEDDVLAEWIIDMSDLYTLYNKCIQWGIKTGSPQRRIEASSYPGVNCYW
jgi:hypothetical protein